jgi:hypothetical protein
VIWDGLWAGCTGCAPGAAGGSNLAPGPLGVLRDGGWGACARAFGKLWWGRGVGGGGWGGWAVAMRTGLRLSVPATSALL